MRCITVNPTLSKCNVMQRHATFDSRMPPIRVFEPLRVAQFNMRRNSFAAWMDRHHSASLTAYKPPSFQNPSSPSHHRRSRHEKWQQSITPISAAITTRRLRTCFQMSKLLSSRPKHTLANGDVTVRSNRTDWTPRRLPLSR